MAMKTILTSSKSAVGSNFNCYFLPKAMLKLKVFRAETITDDGRKRYNFRAEKEIIQTADTKHRYYLQYHASAWTDDSVSIEFTPEGFLQKVQTVTEDQTSAIIGKIAELGKLVAQTVAGIPEVIDRSIAEERVVFEVQFDPFIPTELESINKELEGLKSKDFPDFFLTIDIRLIEDQDATPSIGKAVSTTDYGSGIFCKPWAAAELTIKAGKRSERQFFTLPHPFRVHLVEIARPRWIKYTFSMDFDKGFPKAISINRPSQLLAFINMPINVLKTIFSIPAQMLPVKINLDSTKGAAVAAQTQQLQAAAQQVENQSQMAQLQAQIQMNNMKPEYNGGNDTRNIGERGLDDTSRDILGGNDRGNLRLNPKHQYLSPDE